MVVVLIGADRLLVDTGTIRRHLLGGIPLIGARGLRHLAIHDQGMAVVHQHVPPVAGQCRVDVGLAGQQRVGIGAGAMGLVAELDAVEGAFRPLLAGLWSAKASAGPEGGGGGSSCPSIRSSEACDAQACSRVRSSEKCSSLSSG